MFKKINTILLLVSISFADILNGISVVVNHDIITLHEVTQTSKKMELSIEDTKKFLIIQKLKEQEIKKLNITINAQQVNAEIEKIASQNRMTLIQFKEMLATRFISYDKYSEGILKQLKERTLFATIHQNNMQKPTQEEINIYFKTNKDKFEEVENIKEVEPQIVSLIIRGKEQNIMNSYFEKLQNNAHIEYIR